MIPVNLTPPAYYSEEVAYKALAPLRPFVDAAKAKIVPGLTAKLAKELFGQLERIASNLQQSYTSGALDGSVEWKAKVGVALQDIGAIAAVAGPIQLKYAKLTGTAIANGADVGQAMSSDDANASIIFEQVDIDAILVAIDAVLEV